MSDFIPNSFQTPNAYVDDYMAFLTPEEWKVLTFFIRRIFGFNKREDRIAISQLNDGIFSKEGERLAYGTGLGAAANRKAIASLVTFGLLLRLEENDPHKNEGPLYGLQLDSRLVDLEGLITRYEQRKGEHVERMAKARQQIGTSIEQKGVCPTEVPPLLSNSTHNIQGNPISNGKEKKVSKPAAKKPKPAPTPKEVIDPVIDALSEVTGMDKILNIGQLGREAKAFIRAGITPEELRRYYGQNGIWYRSDWRGQKGQRPDPATIRKTIAGYRRSYIEPPPEFDDDYGPDVGDDNDKPPVEHAEPPAPQPKPEPDYWQRLVELVFHGKPPKDKIGRAVEGARYAGITPDGTMEVIAACDEDRLLLEGRVLPYARQYTHLLDGGSIARVAFVGEG